MKTLDEYNQERHDRLNIKPNNGAGVLCPKCRCEMFYPAGDGGSICASLPPMQSVWCSNNECNYQGYKVI